LSSFFADTSALAKRYIPELGSTWVASWIVPSAGNVTIVSRLCEVEIESLLARRMREGKLSKEKGDLLKDTFSAHLEREYLVVSVDDEILKHARDLVSRYQLRALDAIHLARAVKSQSILGERLTFVSADVNQLAAASGEGFATDSPLAHP
jgi:uncharacterized protein